MNSERIHPVADMRHAGGAHSRGEHPLGQGPTGPSACRFGPGDRPVSPVAVPVVPPPKVAQSARTRACSSALRHRPDLTFSGLRGVVMSDPVRKVFPTVEGQASPAPFAPARAAMAPVAVSPAVSDRPVSLPELPSVPEPPEVPVSLVWAGAEVGIRTAISGSAKRCLCNIHVFLPAEGQMPGPRGMAPCRRSTLNRSAAAAKARAPRPALCFFRLGLRPGRPAFPLTRERAGCSAHATHRKPAPHSLRRGDFPAATKPGPSG